MPPLNNHPDNTCRYCLYLKPPPGEQHASGGNCALHKEWIEIAPRTTCGEMSNYQLQAGIYQLLKRTRGGWRHVRRNKKVRTRLFLVKGGRGRRRRPKRSENFSGRTKLT